MRERTDRCDRQRWSGGHKLVRSEPCHSTSVACSDAPAAAANAPVRATASAISGRTLDDSRDSIECEIHV